MWRGERAEREMFARREGNITAESQVLGINTDLHFDEFTELFGIHRSSLTAYRAHIDRSNPRGPRTGRPSKDDPSEQ